MTPQADRIGLAWRGALAADIFAHLDRIDIVELIADDHFRSPASELRALRLLAGQVPLTLHGTTMGLAGSEPVEQRRLDAMARVVDAVGPVAWSEHLAFVRAGGHEIGHLAAPPRTPRNVDAALRHVARAARTVGRAPQLENIASLVTDPPGSVLDEAAWTTAIVEGAGAPLLLDLHNLLANALNAGADPLARLLAMPLHRVGAVHLSGGRWIDEPGTPAANPRRRLLDDHLHDVPDAVFDLLEHLGARTAGPLDVIVERDGAFPAFDAMLGQVQAARAALARGRARRHADGRCAA